MGQIGEQLSKYASMQKRLLQRTDSKINNFSKAFFGIA